MKKLECVICGSDQVTKTTGTEIFEYMGHKVPIENYVIFQCSNCGEGIADPESRNRCVEILRSLRHSLNLD